MYTEDIRSGFLIFVAIWGHLRAKTAKIYLKSPRK